MILIYYFCLNTCELVQYNPPVRVVYLNIFNSFPNEKHLISIEVRNWSYSSLFPSILFISPYRQTYLSHRKILSISGRFPSIWKISIVDELSWVYFSIQVIPVPATVFRKIIYISNFCQAVLVIHFCGRLSAGTSVVVMNTRYLMSIQPHFSGKALWSSRMSSHKLVWQFRLFPSFRRSLRISLWMAGWCLPWKSSCCFINQKGLFSEKSQSISQTIIFKFARKKDTCLGLPLHLTRPSKKVAFTLFQTNHFPPTICFYTKVLPFSLTEWGILHITVRLWRSK